jgi:hypothetical protein
MPEASRKLAYAASAYAMNSRSPDGKALKATDRKAP